MAKAKKIITRIVGLPNHEFWFDDIDYRGVPERGIIGHKQVTDSYLVALAAAHGGVLATMDDALAAFHSNALII